MAEEELFTRHDIKVRTGMPEDVANYFIREGLLEPVSGGGSQGKHRRFVRSEVTIAAVLFELKSCAGANINVLREVATSLRASLKYVAAFPFSASVMLGALDEVLNEKMGEPPGELDEIPSEAFQAARPLVESNEVYWEARDHLYNAIALEGISGEPDFLYPTDGRWVFHTTPRHVPEETTVFLGIFMDRLVKRVWG